MAYNSFKEVTKSNYTSNFAPPISRRSSAGFTLVEILVCLAILGVLLTIIVPNYSYFKKKAYDFEAQSQLRNVALGEESYYLENETYRPCQDQTCASLPGVSNIDKNVKISVTASADSYVVMASSTKGTGETFVWDSLKGGVQ